MLLGHWSAVVKKIQGFGRRRGFATASEENWAYANLLREREI